MLNSKLSIQLLSKNAVNNKEIIICMKRNIASTAFRYDNLLVPAIEQKIQLKRNFSLFGKRNNNQFTKSIEQTRSIASHEISKSLRLFSEEPRCIKKDSNSLRLETPLDKPLVVLLAWLMSKPKHLKKYAQLYTQHGIDVLTVQVTPWQVIWPTKGSQLVAAELVTFLENNITAANPLVLHGFSVGGYVWGECMVHMSRDIDRFQHVLKQFNGQVWDSTTELTEIPVGIPKAMFPKNDTLQRALSNYMIYHMKAFHDPATSHYIRSSQMFHSTLVKKPALLFLSKTDPIGAVSANLQLKQSWESLGISCDWKCFEKSPHVGHYVKYPEEYENSLFNFLHSVNMIKYPKTDRVQARI